ncbi:DUF3667 domain-containing protein [Fulvivirga lutimaris]|uniref:DUF3667 domain-containing protein n=1 Tax=Fulvivirga lutimaris TaxID=1819566 RepID=UPI0012BBF663|nr:DUF3667 domain-containing protein [Fulvivirga lutimaris]MTI41717.1 DUF3667 domain-containing protein [Fulvivirga lutimaris]
MESSDNVCLNCGHSVENKYCSNCGQKTNQGRFNWKFFWNSVINSAELNKGFLFSAYCLIIKPKVIISEYIEGKRMRYASPVKMAILVGALATFITFNFDFFDPGNADAVFFQLKDLKGFFNYSSRYFSFFTLTAIPFFSLFTWLFFFSSGFNYVENVVLNIYIGVGQFIILILMAPLLLLIDSNTLGLFYGPVNFGYNLLVVILFFKANSVKQWVKAILSVGIPQILVFFLNYFVYRIMPDVFWVFMDSLMA